MHAHCTEAPVAARSSLLGTCVIGVWARRKRYFTRKRIVCENTDLCERCRVVMNSVMIYTGDVTHHRSHCGHIEECLCVNFNIWAERRHPVMIRRQLRTRQLVLTARKMLLTVRVRNEVGPPISLILRIPTSWIFSFFTSGKYVKVRSASSKILRSFFTNVAYVVFPCLCANTPTVVPARAQALIPSRSSPKGMYSRQTEQLPSRDRLPIFTNSDIGGGCGIFHSSGMNDVLAK